MDNSIIIRNVPKGMYVAELCDIFRCFGNIVSVTVQYDLEGHTANEAYMEFDNAHAALRAVHLKHGSELKNRRLDVCLSVEKNHYKQVFVKNFNRDWDECDLLRVFEEIGNIETVKISEGNGKSNGYGFLVFTNHTAAKRAVDCMNGKKIDGHVLIVERFKAKTERENLMQNSMEYIRKKLDESVQRNNLYIKNFGDDMTEKKLYRLFERYGEITSVNIPVDEKGMIKCFGFVSFKNEDDAEVALRKMNGFNVNGKKLQINFKENGDLRKQYNALKNKDCQIKIKQYKQRAKSVPKFLPHSLSYRKKTDFF